MRISGPVLTLTAVGAVAAGMVAANVVLTAAADPPSVEQATGAPAPPAAPQGPAPAASGSGGDGGGY
ncbi:hypothetical protein AD006_04165 [Pseudonocardia sp. EC080610-09]|uniref:hypothetical protein n=1 Tax=unclassified Pseudonocardia TaxID=2619320 RepID=UPI0006CB19EC|nr:MULTISPECIES: hypothetical protein [unclassified Pseudonocardia]ALE75350.1 hypothetical protein FRP1_24985 [Pseudonocardia sp. EC080625-04]ALL74710.1 hypothetical protein AD006_04165 [Pseudonocardia sp. EC080610-09]ALL81733.1 hypothetical protein AD017_11985 [Pseudonocardia sp. EC080619-01]